VSYSVAVIGTGTEPDDPGRDGYAMAYHHATGYEKVDECDLVACADIVEENARAFADEFDLDDGNVFTDYEEMLETVEPEIVSICVFPGGPREHRAGLHPSGVVDAIHREKPMADTYGGARR